MGRRPGVTLVLVFLAVQTLLSLSPWQLSTQAAASGVCADPGFVTAKPLYSLPLTSNPLAADLDGDGHLDLIVTQTNTVAVFRGNGTGGFASPSFFQVAPASNVVHFYPIALGDFNGDNHPDIVVANAPADGEISVLLGNGNGGFGTPFISDTGAHCNQIAVADFNMDGKQDVAFTGANVGSFGGSPRVAVMAGNGSGSLGPPTLVNSLPTNTNFYGLCVNDFNLDGKPDLAVANFNDSSVSIVLNNGQGGFETARVFGTTAAPIDVRTTDFNRDGTPDVVTISNVGGPNTISVLLGDGRGNLGAAINTPYEAEAIVTGDFNDDGIPDIAAANRDGSTLALLPGVPGNPPGFAGSATGHFGPPKEFDAGVFGITGSSLPELAVGDFNEDGELDLVTNSLTIVFGDSTGGLVAARRFPATTGSGSIAKGDFNEDGKLDLILSNYNPGSNSVSLLIGDGAGRFAAPANVDVGVPQTFVAVGDFNGDGHIDFVTANRDNTLSIRLGNGSGGFGPASTFPARNAPIWLAPGDFNNDGKLDVAVANKGYTIVNEAGTFVFPPSIAILLGDGAGGFAAPINISRSVEPSAVAVGDFNRDGNLDLIVTNKDANTVSIRLGDGGGGFGVPHDLNLGNGPVSPIVDDFNGDGNLDVIVANQNYKATITLGDGAGNFGPRREFPISTNTANPQFIAAGDFNNDNLLDLVTNDAIVIGDGTGGFSPPKNFLGSLGAITTGDFNRDGRLDFATSGSYATIFLNTCAPLTKTPFDFDGDGSADVAVYRPSNGVWYIINSGIPGPPSPNNVTAQPWGLNDDILVPADYDGDGKTDIAVYRPSEGNWYIVESHVGGPPSPSNVRIQQWGLPGDIPVPADYDGDGKADIAIFRPSDGAWWIINSSNGEVRYQQWALSGDKPVPADYDGDSKADITVYRPSNGYWFIIQSSNSQVQVVPWGLPGDITVPADYDGDGKTDVAVYRPSDGNWFIVNSTGQVRIQQWGLSGDVPVAGDYDGDGKADLAVYRPSDGNWFIIKSSVGGPPSPANVRIQQWGLPGDLAIPSVYNRP